MQDVLVVGAGLAGLSAACALAADGARVTVLERRPQAFGRAYSYPHPALGEVVDSQHVLLGCCTNLVDLCRQTGADAKLRWYDELVFLEPGGRASVFAPGVLPAPLHQSASFLAAPMLTLADKTAIARGMAEFLRGYPAGDAESFATWLVRTRQTERAIRHFWEPVVAGALNDNFEHCSTRYAGKVFHESFLRSREGGRLGIPAAPLSEFFAPVAEHARSLGVELRTHAGVDELLRQPDGSWLARTGAETVPARAVILAVNYPEARRLLGPLLPQALPIEAAFRSAPITTVHLWFDRDVVGRDHAALLDTRIQWVFAKSRIRDLPPEEGCYLELTISASWPELHQDRATLIDSALRELEMFFPAVRHATLRKSGVLKEARATFSVAPGLDRWRPAQATALPGLFLAADWTDTGWPSTMEGAVRSGRLAAGAVNGELNRYLAPELPAGGLMRWLAGR